MKLGSIEQYKITPDEEVNDVWQLAQSDGWNETDDGKHVKNVYEIRADQVETMGRDQIERNERNRQAKKAYLKSLANKVEDNVIGKFRARL